MQNSLILDIKYLSFISARLKRFKKTNRSQWVCRCPICNDSQKSLTKTRGNFYEYKGSLFFNCYNCNASMHFSEFLKDFDYSSYKDYLMEKFADSRPKKKEEVEIKAPVKNTRLEALERSQLDEVCMRLDRLDQGHEALLYTESRKIPETVYSRLYYVQSIKDMLKIFPDYKEQVRSNESRIVMPFYNWEGKLIGAACRAIHGESLRYFNFKVKDESSLIFGTKQCDLEKPVLVVEGPIDSLFLPNCIAVTGTAFQKLSALPVPKEKRLVIIDNQPRNKEVVKVYEKAIANNENVVIWPSNFPYKDINDAVVGGMPRNEILKILSGNKYSGIAAKLALANWRKI